MSLDAVDMGEKYKKLVKIGSGTFGEAWLVNSVCSGRNYVMKEVRVTDLTEDELMNTQREATVLARCKHINIVRYKESFVRRDPLMMCLVMEHADGGDLFEKEKEAAAQQRLIPEQTVLHWFIQVIFAVHYLHSNNILHRDLKTQNIFLTRYDIVKVGDFGIARFLRTKQDLATTAIGTPYYLSPEICQRKPYNHQSDMWALGCILYELCALKHPFEADDFQNLIVKILLGKYEPLSREYSSLIHNLTGVLLRTNPEKRPNADQLLMIPQMRDLVRNYILRHQTYISKRIQGRRASSSSDGEAKPTAAVHHLVTPSGSLQSPDSVNLDSMNEANHRPKVHDHIPKNDQSQLQADGEQNTIRTVQKSTEQESPQRTARESGGSTPKCSKPQQRDGQTQTPEWASRSQKQKISSKKERKISQEDVKTPHEPHSCLNVSAGSPVSNASNIYGHFAKDKYEDSSDQVFLVQSPVSNFQRQHFTTDHTGQQYTAQEPNPSNQADWHPLASHTVFDFSNSKAPTVSNERATLIPTWEVGSPAEYNMNIEAQLISDTIKCLNISSQNGKNSQGADGYIWKDNMNEYLASNVINEACPDYSTDLGKTFTVVHNLKKGK